MNLLLLTLATNVALLVALFVVLRSWRARRERWDAAREIIHYDLANELQRTASPIDFTEPDQQACDKAQSCAVEYAKYVAKIQQLAESAIRTLCARWGNDKRVELYVLDRYGENFLDHHSSIGVVHLRMLSDDNPHLAEIREVMDALLQGEQWYTKRNKLRETIFGVSVPCLAYRSEGQRFSPAIIDGLVILVSGRNVSLQREQRFLRFWLIDLGRRLFIRYRHLARIVERENADEAKEQRRGRRLRLVTGVKGR